MGTDVARWCPSSYLSCAARNYNPSFFVILFPPRKREIRPVIEVINENVCDGTGTTGTKAFSKEIPDQSRLAKPLPPILNEYRHTMPQLMTFLTAFDHRFPGLVQCKRSDSIGDFLVSAVSIRLIRPWGHKASLSVSRQLLPSDDLSTLIP